MKKFIFQFSRIFLGLLFTTSGFVNAVDPMGTAIKFEEYFSIAFNLPQLNIFAMPLSFLMCAAELWIGIMILLNIAPKLYAWIAALVTLVFTPLTFYLSVANPITDCGCFGDAIKFTNWQTFWKNILIDVFVVIFFVLSKKYPSNLKIKTKFITSILSYLIIILFEFYNFYFLPIIDFMPYKVGANIPELMKIPDNAPKDEYQIFLTSKNIKSEEIKDFTEENYPWEDTTWEWVETKTTLIKKGYIPPIHDFILHDSLGQDYTNEVISTNDTVALIVTYTFETAKEERLQSVIKYVEEIKKLRPNLKIFILTSSSNLTISNFCRKLLIENIVICKIDQVTSKTIVRSNPGLVLIHKGTILGKYSYQTLKIKPVEKIL